MKIAIDVTASIYQGSGIATYYNRLIPELLQLKTEHEFILFGYSFRRKDKLKLAQKKFPLPPKIMEIVWNKIHTFPVELLIGDCDLLHTWDFIQPPTKKAKIITTLHDLTPIKYPQYQHKSIISAYKSGLFWVKKEASAIITDSYATKVEIIESLQVKSQMVKVVYLGVGEEFGIFYRLPQAEKKSQIKKVKKKYKLQTDYLLCVSTREPRKNLQRVIEAYQSLNLAMDLVIAGNYGWGAKEKPASGVKIIGFVEDSDLPALYAGASCFLYPSLYEGFGLPVLEAMAVGCPVLTSYMGSLSEIADDSAVLVNPEKVEAIACGIIAALENKQILIENGLDQVKKFSWKKTAAETLKVYESLA